MLDEWGHFVEEYIDIWTAKNILEDGLTLSVEQEGGVFDFIETVAADEKIEVFGYKPGKNVREKLPSNIWQFVHINPIGMESQDESIYSEAVTSIRDILHAKGSEKFIFERLRFRRTQILAIKTTFENWISSVRCMPLNSKQDDSAKKVILPRRKARRGRKPVKTNDIKKKLLNLLQ